MRIRQSYLGQADKCLRSLQYELEAPPDQYRSGIIRAIGTAYHAGLEYYYLVRQKGPEYQFDCWEAALEECEIFAEAALQGELERAGAAFIWDDKFLTVDAARDAVFAMLKAYQGHAWPTDWTVLGVEHRFELEFDPHVKTGTIDLVLQAPDGGIVGVDHKTCNRMWDQYKHLPRKNNQGPFYTGALRELYPDAPYHRFAFDVMTYAGKFERRISDASDAHVQAVLNKAVQLATLVEGMRGAGMDLPANPASNLCSPKYCDWFDVCPHGSSLDTPVFLRVHSS
jgi:hypothetical protein